MLSSRAHSVRQKSRLAVSLSWVGGYTNAVAVLYCSHMVSNVTGTTTSLALAVSQQGWVGARMLGFVLATFWFGAVASALMTENFKPRGLRSRYVLPMAVEALFLGIFAIGIKHHPSLPAAESLTFYWLVGAASFAMGLQNATITKISGAVVRTTHLTGVVTDFGLESVHFLLWFRSKTGGRGATRRKRVIQLARRNHSLQRIAVLGSIIASFSIGATAGGLAFTRFQGTAMVAPVIFLLAIVLFDWFRPIADIREIDAINDAELRINGIVKEILPPELGIYRLFDPERLQRAPNFQVWVDLLPQRWRVVILSLSPHIRFDDRSAADLQAALEKLHADGRKLIIAGVTPLHYRALSDLGIAKSMDIENLCSDLEYAVARGILAINQTAGRRRNGNGTAQT